MSFYLADGSGFPTVPNIFTRTGNQFTVSQQWSRHRVIVGNLNALDYEYNIIPLSNVQNVFNFVWKLRDWGLDEGQLFNFQAYADPYYPNIEDPRQFASFSNGLTSYPSLYRSIAWRHDNYTQPMVMNASRRVQLGGIDTGDLEGTLDIRYKSTTANPRPYDQQDVTNASTAVCGAYSESASCVAQASLASPGYAFQYVVEDGDHVGYAFKTLVSLYIECEYSSADTRFNLGTGSNREHYKTAKYTEIGSYFKNEPLIPGYNYSISNFSIGGMTLLKRVTEVPYDITHWWTDTTTDFVPTFEGGIEDAPGFVEGDLRTTGVHRRYKIDLVPADFDIQYT